MVARDLIALWKKLPEREKSAHPHHLRTLLNPGPLRVALEEFSEGNINPLTGYPFPLRKWPPLHEHIYAFCGPLFKATAIDNEWAFSVLSAFLNRGNHNAGMWRMAYELLRTSGDIDKVVSMNLDDLRKARELKSRIIDWRKEKVGKERSLLYGAYTNPLLKLKFEELKEATSGNAAVPGILHRFYQCDKGDWSKVGLRKLRTLILRWGGELKGRITKEREGELRSIWERMKPTEAELRAEAQKYIRIETAQIKKVKSAYNSDDDVSSGI